MSELNEMDDPEASYRGGYQQGAYAAAQAAGRLAIFPDGLTRLLRWAGVDLNRWRYHDGPSERFVSPPPQPPD
jgi:hypothetical protein